MIKYISRAAYKRCKVLPPGVKYKHLSESTETYIMFKVTKMLNLYRWRLIIRRFAIARYRL